MSGHFQGYAQMTSPIGQRRATVWSEANEGANPWGGTFSVKWLRLYDLPFQRTVHLKNPLNHFKPVKISRDCQELAQDIGESLCSLIDEGAEREENMKRKVGASTGSGLKRPRGEPFDMLPENHFVPHLAAAALNSPMSTGVYPGQQVKADPAHKLYTSPRLMNRSIGGLSNRASSHVEQSRGSRSRSPQNAMGSERERDTEWFRDYDKAMSSAEQEHWSGMNSCKVDFPPEEDLLNMTYEEYLQRHGCVRSYMGNHQPPGTAENYPSGSVQGGWIGDNSGVACQDDQYSVYLANWYNRQGQLTQGDAFYGAHGVGGSYSTLFPSNQNWNGRNNSSMFMQPIRSGGRVSAGARDHHGH